MADDNLGKNSNNNTDITTNLESTLNVASLLQLLTNPTVLQQAITNITTQNQQIPFVPISTPNSTISIPSNTLIGVINISFPRGSIQNPITKEE
ncbi:17786_t:CDS:2, partial [Funneliformis geosporum]